MEIARHWRLRRQRYNLVGGRHVDPITGEETFSFGLGPNRPQFSPNGHSQLKEPRLSETIMPETDLQSEQPLIVHQDVYVASS